MFAHKLLVIQLECNHPVTSILNRVLKIVSGWGNEYYSFYYKVQIYTHISVYTHKLIYSIWMVLKFLGVREVIRKKVSKKAPKGNKNRLRNTALQNSTTVFLF